MFQIELSNFFKLVFFFASKTVVDIFFHPLHLLESRFILQDGRPDLKYYKNFRNTLMKLNKRDFFKGWLINFPVNILSLITMGNTMDPRSDIYFNVLKLSLSNTILYPFITVRRRIDCQDYESTSMLKPRYNNIRHAFKLIYFEEGLKGLYRGFFLFNLNMLMISAVLMLNRKSDL